MDPVGRQLTPTAVLDGFDERLPSSFALSDALSVVGQIRLRGRAELALHMPLGIRSSPELGRGASGWCGSELHALSCLWLSSKVKKSRRQTSCVSPSIMQQ